MKRLEKVLLCTIAVICLVCFIWMGFGMYISKYKIIPGKAELEDAILQFINRPTVVTNNIDIKQEQNFDNKKYILFNMGSFEGYAEFTEGINQKYKIGQVGYGSSIFRSEIIKTDTGKYVLIICKNHNNNIQYANVLLANQEYKIDIPQEEYAIAYCKVPNSMQVGFIDISNIQFYSINKDITQEVLFNQ